MFPAYIMCSYIDDIFFTSNEPLEKINQMLNGANNLHPNIKLVRQIGTSVAVRYSSTLSAFHAERRSIKLMLLYNGYMFHFLHNCSR